MDPYKDKGLVNGMEMKREKRSIWDWTIGQHHWDKCSEEQWLSILLEKRQISRKVQFEAAKF